MRWIASLLWGLIAGLATNGLIAFILGGLDHSWLIAGVAVVWVVVFLVACPRLYDISGRPARPG